MQGCGEVQPSPLASGGFLTANHVMIDAGGGGAGGRKFRWSDQNVCDEDVSEYMAFEKPGVDRARSMFGRQATAPIA